MWYVQVEDLRGNQVSRLDFDHYPNAVEAFNRLNRVSDQEQLSAEGRAWLCRGDGLALRVEYLKQVDKPIQDVNIRA